MIGCIIQARMGSSRLPGKVIQKIDSTSMILDYVINQIKYSKRIEKIIVATTNLTEDDVICEHLVHKKSNSLEDLQKMYWIDIINVQENSP